ncbi:MAG: teichoic acid transporter [Leptolyngbya sp. DLM2.Bin15]|nr:MAG: teichoic acid transporter [Leptolyngbya sp. DLM2.Bin15]
MADPSLTPSPEPTPDPGKPSLKARAIRGSMWTLGGYGANQVLRFASNLILTRLLFPEAFGLMSLVQIFLQGLEMFSDIGIKPSIIHDKRGDDPAFLNTAWTIQAGRGVGLWLLSCAIAFPASQFYREPMLTQLLPVVGLTALISGFTSTKLPTANRNLRLGFVTALELTAYVVGLVVMILCAWWYESVWALVVGGLVDSMVRMILSHVMLPGISNRFHWESEAFKSLYRFGRWIFISTALTFLAGQGDRLILGRLLDVRFLGIYTIALTLSRFPRQAISQIIDRVLFPSYAELIRDRPERMYVNLRKSRLGLITISWGISLMFILLGPTIINTLYDARYADAGWIIQIVSLGSLIGIVGGTYDGVLMAQGKTFLVSLLLIVQIVTQLGAMVVGYQLNGQTGVIWGLASVTWVTYPIKAVIFSRLSLWQPELDMPFLGAAGVIIAASIYFLNLA